MVPGTGEGRLKGTNLCNFFVVCLCVFCAVLYPLDVDLVGIYLTRFA